MGKESIEDILEAQKRNQTAQWPGYIDKIVTFFGFIVGLIIVGVFLKAIQRNWDLFLVAWIILAVMSIWVKKRYAEGRTKEQYFSVIRVFICSIMALISCSFILSLDTVYDYFKGVFIKGGEWYLYVPLMVFSALYIVVLIGIPGIVFVALREKKPKTE